MEKRYLEINGCSDCPHHIASPKYDSEDSYYSSCNENEESEEEVVRIKSTGFFHNCPLETLEELLY